MKAGQKLTPDQAARQREWTRKYYRAHTAEISERRKRQWALRTGKAAKAEAKAAFDAEYAGKLTTLEAMAEQIERELTLVGSLLDDESENYL